MKKIAIIGAGLAGLTAANKLKEKADITIFEKARGVSGRLSTRRAEPFHFDHGAPFFKARSQSFKDFLAPLIDAGVVKRWDALFAEFDGIKMINKRVWGAELPHYVGAPKMSAMTKYLSQGLTIQLGTRVNKIDKKGNVWQLFDDNDNIIGTFDWIICTAPAEQSAEIIPQTLEIHKRIKTTKMQGCYALMLGFNSPIRLDFDAALIRNSDLSWVSINSNKPERPDSFALTILSSNKWADANIEADQKWAREHLLAATNELLNINASTASHIALHRWRYANADKQEGKPFLIDSTAKIGVCGDWLIRGNVEAAYSSADALSQSLEEFL